MARGIDPGSFTNAFNTQRQLGAQLRAAAQDEELRALQIGRAEGINALGKNPNATAEQYIRAGDPVTGNALAGVEQDRQRAMQTAFPRVGSLAVQISGIADPAQKRAAFKQAITTNSQLFDALGMPSGEAIAKLDASDDATLDATLAALTKFAPAAAPIEITAGNSLVRPGANGGFETAYTAPAKPAAADDPYAKIDPANFTQASIAKFEVTGKRSDLVPREKVADPATQASALAALRDDHRTESKMFGETSAAYQRIQDSAANPDAVGDIALLFNYLKVLDPGSTVREGEFHTVASAGGLPAQVQSLYNRMVNGELPPEVRSSIVSRATQLYRGQEKRFQEQVLDRNRGLYKRAGGDPADLMDPRAAPPAAAAPGGGGQPGEPVRVNTPADAAKLPPGTVFITPDGRRKVVPGG